MKPIDTAPEGVWILTYADWTVPPFAVCRYKTETHYEDVLVQERGNRRTYERRELKSRAWEGTHWEPTHWTELPKEPKEQS